MFPVFFFKFLKIQLLLQMYEVSHIHILKGKILVPEVQTFLGARVTERVSVQQVTCPGKPRSQTVRRNLLWSRIQINISFILHTFSFSAT